MDKLNVWEVENEVGFFKIDSEKVSFKSKAYSRMDFEDFYYHPNGNPRTDGYTYFNISTKFVIKDIAIYYDGSREIILCFKNDIDIVKILKIYGHNCNDITTIDLKAVDFHYNCGHVILHGKPLEVIKSFDELHYEKIANFRLKNYERI